MKNRIPLVMAFLFLLASCGPSRNAADSTSNKSITATIDLVNVANDQVNVTVNPPIIESSTVTYNFAKIIPGTYAIADYGRYIEDFKAFDKSGKLLPITKKDVNTWEINNASKLTTITYKVNDTFDSEEGQAFDAGSTTIFSPAGTNILAGEQFMLNMCGFIGYFNDKANLPYKVFINHPENLQASTSLDDTNPANGADLFTTTRYAEIVDHPIMYAKPDIATARIGDMDLILSFYSPRKKSITADAFMPDIKKMISAQKAYLGKINNTKNMLF
jgi:predicted metalloprotease with PDZ domain